MKSSALSSVLAALAVCLGSTEATRAQLLPRGASTSAFTSAPSTFASAPAVFQNGVIGLSTYSTTMTGDASVVLPPPTDIGTPVFTSTEITGNDAFTVGALPVQISNLHLDGNFKLVNSGGSASSQAQSYVGYSLAIRQFSTPFVIQPAVDPLVGALVGNRPVLNGNGFVVDSFSQDSALAPYVLVPGLSYYFQIFVEVSETTPSPFDSPQYGYTLEFGGPFSAGTYAGFTASFDYQTVPAPGGLAAVAATGLCLIRRRRR